jgi:hypothetical protein
MFRQRIDSQASMDMLIRGFGWTDSVFREAYLLSPSYVFRDDSGKAWTSSHGALPSFKCLITVAKATRPGVELVFVGVKDLHVSFESDFSPKGSYSDERIVWNFTGYSHEDFECQRMFFTFCDETCWGNSQRYSWEPILGD